MFCSYNGICFCISATFCSLPMGCPLLVFLRARGRESHRPGELCMCRLFWIWIASAGVLIQEALGDQVPDLNASFLVDGCAANIVWQLGVVMWCQFISTKLISKKTLTSILSLSQRCWKWGSDCHGFLVRIFFLHRNLPDCVVLPTRTPMTEKSPIVLVF